MVGHRRPAQAAHRPRAEPRRDGEGLRRPRADDARRRDPRARRGRRRADTRDARAGENALTGALRQLFALAEAYPDLKANANFIQLQGSLSEIEDAIQSARRYYNAVVRDLNTSVQTFPSNFVASFFQFHPRGYFELDSPQERQAPRVAFGS